jgi:hypothetical protein
LNNTEAEIPRETSLPISAAMTDLQVSLERSMLTIEQELLSQIDDPLWKALNTNRMYSLKVNDPSGKYPNRTIPLADMGKAIGGITLSNWKVTHHKDQAVLSVCLRVNMMGHDLDQWIHYDLATGKELGRSPAN